MTRLNPADIPPTVSGGFTSRPLVLDGKTVFRRWNGKHNGDVFLARIGEQSTTLKINDNGL